jgi:glycerol kinase
MGASYLAGLAVGFWSSKEDVIKNWAIDREFEPSMTEEARAEKLKGWKQAVKATLGWAKG